VASAPRSTAHLTMGVALAQAVLAYALSLVASSSVLRSWPAYRWDVERPLLFALIPLVTAVGIIVHLRSCRRHMYEACQWIGLAWMLLSGNLTAILLFTLAPS
jgi:hypothetical protein